jgi:hypothetical protein
VGDGGSSERDTQLTLSHRTQGGAILEGVGLSRRHFLTLASATAALGALGVGTTGIASADAGSGTGTFSGSVAPNSGGNFAKYLITNPSGAKVTINFVYSPWVAGEAHRVGISVWQGGKKIASGSGQATGLHNHVNSNMVNLTVTPKAGEKLLVKVFNYSPDTVNYTLTISGDTVVASTFKRPEEPAPVPLNGSATGTLDGVGGITTMDYSIAAPTGDKITVSMDYSPFDAAEAHRVGFAVWQNGKRILRETGHATGYKDHTNSSNPTGSVTPKANEPLLIKVFNLNTLSPVSYTLTVK